MWQLPVALRECGTYDKYTHIHMCVYVCFKINFDLHFKPPTLVTQTGRCQQPATHATTATPPTSVTANALRATRESTRRRRINVAF